MANQTDKLNGNQPRGLFEERNGNHVGQSTKDGCQKPLAEAVSAFTSYPYDEPDVLERDVRPHPVYSDINF